MLQHVRALYKNLCIAALVPVSIAILVQMFYVSINVGGRYLFNQPVAGAMEASGEAMIYIVYLSLAYIQLGDNHIRIDFIFPFINTRTKGLIDSIACLMGIVFFSFLSWLSFKSAMHSLDIQEVVWGSVAFPIYPQRLVVSLGSLMMAIQLFLDLMQTILTLIAPIKPKASDEKLGAV